MGDVPTPRDIAQAVKTPATPVVPEPRRSVPTYNPFTMRSFALKFAISYHTGVSPVPATEEMVLATATKFVDWMRTGQS